MEPDCDIAHLTGQPLYRDARPEREAVANLLAAAGMSGDFDLLPLAGGANNLVCRVETNGTRSLLKSYFRHPNDPRDRLKAEYCFATFAWNSGLRTVPQPLACSFQHGLALFEFVDGRSLKAHEITADMVAQTLDFFVDLNQRRHGAEARSLPRASESCARIVDHLQCVDRRVQRLGAIDCSSPIDRDVVGFVRDELSATWARVRETALNRTRDSGLTLKSEMPNEDWCLSPSDFGFHNVIVPEDGRLRFVDFEYAGWDDPARMVCDFFCQQQVPVPKQHYDLTRDAVAGTVSDPSRYRIRVEILMPVYQIKWCCIVLNEFVPEGRARRRFAGRSEASYAGKAAQLRKARDMLATVVC